MTEKQSRSAEDRLPDRLARLKSASASWGFFAGNFEFEEDRTASALAWFDGRQDAARRFLVFGHEGSGGLYAIWLQRGRPVDDAPVVLLGSEGDVRVLAANVDAFLSLLALDLVDLGTSDGLSAQDPMGSEDHARYEAWLRSEGLDRAIEPERGMLAARAAFPGLAKFVERVMTSGDGSEWVTPEATPPGPSEIPDDPVEILNQPGHRLNVPPGSGVEIACDDSARIKTVFLTAGAMGSRLRPRGHALLGMSRDRVASALGAPTKSRTTWDRFDRDDVALHIEYSSGIVSRVTLM